MSPHSLSLRIVFEHRATQTLLPPPPQQYMSQTPTDAERDLTYMWGGDAGCWFLHIYLVFPFVCGHVWNGSEQLPVSTPQICESPSALFKKLGHSTLRKKNQSIHYYLCDCWSARWIEKAPRIIIIYGAEHWFTNISQPELSGSLSLRLGPGSVLWEWRTFRIVKPAGWTEGVQSAT